MILEVERFGYEKFQVMTIGMSDRGSAEESVTEYEENKEARGLVIGYMISHMDF